MHADSSGRHDQALHSCWGQVLANAAAQVLDPVGWGDFPNFDGW
jgi:hypothetical protein